LQSHFYSFWWFSFDGDVMKRHVHLIGIGGTGLSAIARLLLERGDSVSGSDRSPSPLATALQAAGAQVFTGHRAENIQGADLVVRSSAIPDDNLEVMAARQAGIPVLKRADFLGQLMDGCQGIAIAGTHGKTTTTAMIAWVLTALDQDPSYIIGGVSANLGNNAHAGRGTAFVIEADEYDRMFLGLNPSIAVVTNVEHDHPDCYPTPQDFYQAFEQFVSRLSPEGTLLACGDDPGARRLLSERAASERRVKSYGLGAWLGKSRPNYYALNLAPNTLGGFSFEAVCAPNEAGTQAPVIPVDLQVPGQHNVRNALAALGVVDVLGLPLARAAHALAEFRGTGRRFEVRGEVKGITVIDDYAHHPTEIRATLAAARSRYPGRRIWAVWQPHTYSRTRTLLADFAQSFADADRVLITPVYAARENPPEDGFGSGSVAARMAHPDAQFVPDLDQTVGCLLDQLRSGDVLLVLSAGDADQISTRVLDSLE
jgi:UDP-N-acetylmuramate--alanine ligase